MTVSTSTSDLSDHSRVVWADVLRIVSAIAVIWLHVAASWLGHFNRIQPPNEQWLLVQLFRTLPSFAVPAFFMLSGMFYLNPTRPVPLNKILASCRRLFLAFAYWSLFYAIGFPTQFHKPAIHALVKGHVHLWFLPALASCYLATPALRLVIRDRKTVLFTLGSAAALVLLPATLRAISPRLETALPGAGGIAFVSAPVFYFLAGEFVHTCTSPSKHWIAHAILIAVGGAAIVGSFALTVFGRARLGQLDAFLGANHFLVALFSIVIFVAFKFAGIQTGQTLHNRWIQYLSGLTFGVYLIHPAVLDLLPDGFGYPPWLAIPGKTLVAFVASALVIGFLKKIPVLRILI